MDELLDAYDLPKLNYDEINNLKRSIRSSEREKRGEVEGEERGCIM